MLAEGAQAPEFELASDAGETVRLSDLRGTPVVLYFYPKDDTPGCTVEACGFRDAHDRFGERGAVVLGVSPDDEASHARFKEKHGLPFTLLADTEREVSEAYGAWADGKIQRSTFVIAADGTVARVFPQVTPEGHADEILAALP